MLSGRWLSEVLFALFSPQIPICISPTWRPCTQPDTHSHLSLLPSPSPFSVCSGEKRICFFPPFNLFFFHIRDVHQITAEPTLNWLKYAITCECRYSFRKLHCTRNYIHIQMFISFILRAIFIFIRDSLLFTNEEHYHCDYYPVWMDGRFVIPLLLSFRQGHECDELTFSPCAQVACKVVLMLTNYSILANYSWLLVEGHFLFTLVSRSFFSLKKHLAWYIVLGWGKEPGWQESSAA